MNICRSSSPFNGLPLIKLTTSLAIQLFIMRSNLPIVHLISQATRILFRKPFPMPVSWSAVSNLHLCSSLTVLLVVSELQVLHYKFLIHLELFAVKGKRQQPNLIHLLTKLSFLQYVFLHLNKKWDFSLCGCMWPSVLFCRWA